MTLNVVCSCGKSLRVRPEHVGKRVKCPACQAAVEIPGLNEASSAAASKSRDEVATTDQSSSRSSTSTPDATEKDSGPATKSPQTPAAIKPSETPGSPAKTTVPQQTPIQPKSSALAVIPTSPIADLLDELGFHTARSRNSCPQCKATLAEEAVLCVHCGFHLEKGKALKTKRVGRLES